MDCLFVLKSWHHIHHGPEQTDLVWLLQVMNTVLFFSCIYLRLKYQGWQTNGDIFATGRLYLKLVLLKVQVLWHSRECFPHSVAVYTRIILLCDWYVVSRSKVNFLMSDSFELCLQFIPTTWELQLCSQSRSLFRRTMSVAHQPPPLRRPVAAKRR